MEARLVPVKELIVPHQGHASYFPVTANSTKGGDEGVTQLSMQSSNNGLSQIQ